MIIGVHHIGITVANPAKVTWLDHIATDSYVDWIECPNIRFKLTASSQSNGTSPPSRPVNLPGIAHICLQSRDINEGLKLGVAAGIDPISGPVDLGTAFRYLYAHTDDGILLELEGAPFVQGLGPRFWVGHVAFVAKDIVPLVEFYGAALGLKPSPVSRLHPNPVFDKVAGLSGVDLSAMWLPGLNLGLEFWQYHNPPTPIGGSNPLTGFTYICFECDDFSGDVAIALAAGATAESPADLGLSNCQIASFNDPEGNSFSLVAFDDPADPMAIQHLSHKGILDQIATQHAAIQSR